MEATHFTLVGLVEMYKRIFVFLQRCTGEERPVTDVTLTLAHVDGEVSL